jgi:DNA primase catalytic subunit
MLLSRTLRFYKRDDVRRRLKEHAKNREIAVRYEDYFGKRPDTVEYEDDVLEFAKDGAVSFHCSEERWANPTSLRSGIGKEEMDDLRVGWDLLLDIDCDHYPYSRVAAHHLVQIIQDHGVESVTAKFSGNTGFHIAVPFEAFPDRINGRRLTELFPEAPRRTSAYLASRLYPIVREAVKEMEDGDLQRISEQTGVEPSTLIQGDEDLRVPSFLEIDTVAIAPRHLYRMPYSFHEKSGLISQPVEPADILSFERLDAKPEKADLSVPFLDRDVEEGDAENLIVQAFDHKPQTEKEADRPRDKEFDTPEEAIAREYFPPTIKKILDGLSDGRKRASFTLCNFLRCVGWSYEQIEHELYEWNERNDPPLRDVYLEGQLKQMKKQKELIPPHNYPHAGTSYYKDLGVYEPDNLTEKVKNPVQYARLKSGGDDED